MILTVSVSSVEKFVVAAQFAVFRIQLLLFSNEMNCVYTLYSVTSRINVRFLSRMRKKSNKPAIRRHCLWRGY